MKSRRIRRIRRTLGCLPKWAWYFLSFFVAGPFGPLGVYLLFYALKKMEANAQEDEWEAFSAAQQGGSVYADADCSVHADPAPGRNRDGHAEYADDGEEDEIAALLREGQSALLAIRRANDLIPDPALSARIDSIENSCRQIFTILEQRPQLLSELRSFLRYYLPTTLKLLDARVKLERSASTSKAIEVRTRINEALRTVDTAFLRQLEALDAYRFLDLESEMDVLSDMLRADGLLDDDAPLSADTYDPFADVLNERRGKNRREGQTLASH